MKILDLKVGEYGNLGKCAIISVEIRYGHYTWNKPYAIPSKDVANFNYERLKEKVYTDAQVLVKDKQLEDSAFKQIEDVIGVDINLD